MITAGVDIGSLSANAVILGDDGIMAWHNTLTGPDSAETSWRVINETLDRSQNGLKLEDIDYIVATGYGRIVVPFSQATITEISCHARGNHWFFPEVRTILDMGGQDCKAIRCDARGKVTNFAMNDKCAAGTGRYLERVASTLSITLEEFGPLSLHTVEGPVAISDFCTVFAQRDIILLMRQGAHRNDILAGACEAIVKRILPLLQRVGVEQAFAISGGVAKNTGVVERLEAKLGMKARIAFDPQIVGALGAALFARDRALKAQASSAPSHGDGGSPNTDHAQYRRAG
ncbi:MAG TPA: benzoyl-CoA reductase, bzd-type, subunit Q [Dehalococcoidia bacterium]|nr:benzoyl-CoA reductase, bzd-type, subunit Q [Dehalococcoidia bacterium]